MSTTLPMLKNLLILTTVLCFALTPMIASAGTSLSEGDQRAIRAAALDYAEGWYSGDRTRMERSLHDALAKRAYLPDAAGQRRLSQMDKASLLSANKPENAARYAKAPKRAEVLILSGFGNAASVRLAMDGWVDYMHVVRTEEGAWRIVNVLWELEPKEKKAANHD